MLFNKKSSKAFITKLVAVFMSAVIFSLLTGAVIDIQTKKITLVTVDAFADSEKTQELTTKQNYVSDFFEENDIKTGEYDNVSMLMEDELYDGARIVVRKGRKFTLNIDGNIEIITTTKKTVREAFEEAGVTLRQTDEGSVMIGDSADEAGLDERIGLGVLGAMADRAVRMFPAVGRLNVVRSWAALRVMTRDGFPVYDHSEEMPGAFLATCHSGVTLAAAHSGPLAGMIADGALATDMAPFSARRFDVPAVA